MNLTINFQETPKLDSMKTVVVPFDFSPISLNAAKYATRMLTGYYGITMVLYHAYRNTEDRDEVMLELDRLREYLRTVGIVKTEIMSGQSDDLIASLERLCLDVNADLVVMGITGRSAVEQKLIGSNTLRMMEKNICPVLIVPPDASFREIKNVILTSEMRKVELSTPATAIQKILKTYRPKLHILNVNQEHFISISDEYRVEMEKMKQMFAELHPDFYFLDLHDTVEAISQFSTDRAADLLILIHREKSFMDRLFKGSHTRKMAYQSTIPVLALHE